MRLRAISFALIALGGAAFGAWTLAGAATDFFERRTETEAAAALVAAGQGWARVEADGLTVTLAGLAPDEASRLRAVEILRQLVDPRRLAEELTVKAADPLAPPPFAIEILRNMAEVSLIGLAPDDGIRDRIDKALSAAGPGATVTDMLETAAEPAPAGWEPSLAFALDLLVDLPRAKISIAPGRVTVLAAVDSDAGRTELEARLREAVPEGVTLETEISAPRPVIAPFAVDFALDGTGARLAACSAETPEAAEAIVTAARAAGLEGPQDCAIGLGAPSLDWQEVATLGIETVGALGGGRFAVRDTRATLTGPASAKPEDLNAAGKTLAARLPAGYDLRTVTPPRMEARPDGTPVYAPRFEARLGADGSVELAGALHDTRSQAAVASYAAALFGHDRVRTVTVIDPELPDGWPGRVLAGIEALAEIKEGSLQVTPTALTLTGRGIEADADARVEALLAAKVSGETLVDVTFDVEAASLAAAAARPAPERCAEEIAAILANEAIQFRAGSSEIEPASQGVIAAIADVLRECPGAEFEVGGHSDSSGDEAANQRLSEARATAVVAALRAEDLPLVMLTSRGYGAAHPLAGNETPAGRTRNRRIEILLVDPTKAAEAAVEPGEDPAAAAGKAQACAEEIAAILQSGAVEFGLGSAEIVPESAGLLAAVAETMRTCPGASFEIGGHTDSRGRAEVNQQLSEKRAEAVREALAGEDLPDITLVSRGYGADRPIADNDTAEGRMRNRRIEITLLDPDPAQAETADETAPDDVAVAGPKAEAEAEAEAAHGPQ